MVPRFEKGIVQCANVVFRRKLKLITKPDPKLRTLHFWRGWRLGPCFWQWQFGLREQVPCSQGQNRHADPNSKHLHGSNIQREISTSRHKISALLHNSRELNGSRMAYFPLVGSPFWALSAMACCTNPAKISGFTSSFSLILRCFMRSPSPSRRPSGS